MEQDQTVRAVEALMDAATAQSEAWRAAYRAGREEGLSVPRRTQKGGYQKPTSRTRTDLLKVVGDVAEAQGLEVADLVGEIASMSGLSRSAASNLIKHGKNPTWGSIVLVSAALGVDTVWLCDKLLDETEIFTPGLPNDPADRATEEEV